MLLDRPTGEDGTAPALLESLPDLRRPEPFEAELYRHVDLSIIATVLADADGNVPAVPLSM